MRPLDGTGRLVAPDLIGMGDSEKLSPAGSDTYRFATHSHYLAGFIEQIIPAPEKAVLIVHDWGSALGFDWANRHRDRAAAIVYMEALVRPIASWDEWNKAATPIFQGFRSDKGEDMVLNRNMFVERVLPGSILRKLTDEEMIEYRRPFLDPADRWPTLTWPRELPIAGEPADVVARVEHYSQWLASSQIPKLFVNLFRDIFPAARCVLLICFLSTTNTPQLAAGIFYCRARRDSDRLGARVLPDMAEPDRGNRGRLTFHPGGFRRGDRPGHSGLAREAAERQLVRPRGVAGTTPRPEALRVGTRAAEQT
jgi:pimeloyl-ACP methyl ester carboxylesterase